MSGTWKDLTDNVNAMADNLTDQVRNIAEVTTAVATGRPVQEDHGRRARRGARAEGDHQHDGRPAALVRRRGDARREGSGHRRPAGRPGQRGRRQRHVEGPDGQRQHAGRQPDDPGAQHRRGDHRGRQRRPLQEDHRRRQGRDPPAEEHDQHDGRPALVVRRRGHARRPRGRHRGQARRPGAR